MQQVLLEEAMAQLKAQHLREATLAPVRTVIEGQCSKEAGACDRCDRLLTTQWCAGLHKAAGDSKEADEQEESANHLLTRNAVTVRG